MCFPTRPPVQPPGIRQPTQPSSNSKSAHVPSRLKKFHHYHNHRGAFEISIAKAGRQFSECGADVPLKTPLQSLPQHRNNRQNTSHPLRRNRCPSSAKNISEWKRSSKSPSTTRMNPMASAFAPKPSYAQKVKASLPRRSVGEGEVTSVASSGEGTEVGMSEALSIKQPSKNTHTAHRSCGDLADRRAVAEAPSQSAGVARSQSTTPKIKVMMGGEKSQTGSNFLHNPLARDPGTQQARYVLISLETFKGTVTEACYYRPNAYAWYNGQHISQPPTLFQNPLFGHYESHSPMPGSEYVNKYYDAHLPQASPVPWDPAVAAAAWEHFHRSQSAQAMYGPFPPPPIPPHDMQQAGYTTPQPIPPFAPFSGWLEGHPVPGTSMEAQGQLLHPPPAPSKRAPSRGKLYQMIREAQKTKQSREHNPARAEAVRTRNDRLPTPLLRDRGHFHGPPIPSYAHAKSMPPHKPTPRLSVSPAPLREFQQPHPEVDPPEQRGRSQYRLISAKSTARHDGPNRQKQRADDIRETGSDSNDSALMFGEDKVDPRDVAHLASQGSGDSSKTPLLQAKAPKSSTQSVKADGPPPNAPTGPAFLRRFANLQQQHRTSLTQKPAEQGSWSQSKRWVSQETKERIAFQKLMHTLRYMGADKSPFLPQTPAELTRFKIAQADHKSKKMSEKLSQMEERMYRRRKAQREGVCLNEAQPELCGGKKMSDNLSPFFAQASCFNGDLPPEGSELVVEWPCRAEMKEEGDKRAARYGRYFPLPRLNVVATRILEEETVSPYNDDGTISWEKKAVKHMSRFIRPVTSELEPCVDEAVQFEVHDLHHSLRDLLEEIDTLD